MTDETGCTIHDKFRNISIITYNVEVIATFCELHFEDASFMVRVMMKIFYDVAGYNV